MPVPTPEINLANFEILLKQNGLPQDRIRVEQLYEGYLKLRAMVCTLHRPTDLKTGLAVDFKPTLLS